MKRRILAMLLSTALILQGTIPAYAEEAAAEALPALEETQETSVEEETVVPEETVPEEPTSEEASEPEEIPEIPGETGETENVGTEMTDPGMEEEVPAPEAVENEADLPGEVNEEEPAAEQPDGEDGETESSDSDGNQTDTAEDNDAENADTAPASEELLPIEMENEEELQAALAPESVMAMASAEQYGDFTYSISNDSVTITGYTGSAAEVTVPGMIDEYAVTSIGSGAFQNCTTLQKVVLPESVISIDGYAFSGCSSLEELELPESLKSMGSYVIEGTAVKSLRIPAGFTSPPTYINGHIYPSLAGANYLEEVIIESGMTEIPNALCMYASVRRVVLPDTVTVIGSSAFDGCSKLETIQWSSALKKIDGSAFSDCTSLTELVPPDSVTEIGESAFSGCTSLTNIVLPDGITNIESHAFSYCTALTGVSLPEGIASIKYGAFRGCTALQKLVLPDSVNDIGRDAFHDCTSLTEVSLPDSLINIDDYAFAGCSSLEELELPESLKSMGSYVIEGTAVKSLRIPAGFTSPPTYINGHIYPSLAGANYLEEVIIESGMTEIPNALCMYASVRRVVLPDTVTVIGGSVFSGCSKLTSINWPSALKKIDGSAFDGCTSLTEVTLPDGLNTIGGSGFRNCTAMTKINVPATVTSIGSSAFSGCTNLVMYGQGGSYAESYAKENSIPFNVLTEGTFLMVGSLEAVNAESLAVSVDGSSYSVSDDLTLTSAADILANAADKTVICYIEDGLITHIDAAEDMLVPYATIYPSGDGVIITASQSGGFSVKYRDGRYSCTQIPLKVTIGCRLKSNDLYTESDLALSADELCLKISEFRLGVSGAGFLFSGLSQNAAMEKTLRLTIGEEKTYESRPTLAAVSGYVPDTVSSLITVQGQILREGSSEYEVCGKRNIHIQNEDIQGQKAQEKKENSETWTEAFMARCLLDSNTAVALDAGLNYYLEQGQLETLHDFLTIWSSMVLQLKRISYCSQDDQIMEKVLGKLGVNSNSTLLARKTHGSITLQGNTKYGEKSFVFNLDVDGYAIGKTDFFGANGTITWYVKDPSGIPSGIPTSGTGGVVFADLEDFAEQVGKVAETAVKNVYKEAWGKNADAVAELIVGGTLSKILDKTGYSFSNCVFKLLTEPAKNTKTRIGIHCPVDVYVYDSSRSLCGVIRDNTADPAYDEVFMYVEDDSKYVVFTGDDYYIKLVGTDTGTMDYEIEECAEDEIVRTVSFRAVPLTAGKTYEGYIPEQQKLDHALYELNGDADETIVPDTDTWQDTLEARVYAEGIRLSQTAADCIVGDTVTLTASVQPENATDRNVTWSSSDESTASVKDGRVTARKPGKAVITAEAWDGGFTASCTVSVGQKSVNALTVFVPDSYYTGSAVTPAVTVKDGSEVLVLDRDYQAAYTDNGKIGTAAVTITGIGRYTGSKTAAFRILEKAHSFSGWKVTKEATCLKAGEQARTCSICGRTETQSIAKRKPTIKLTASSLKMKVKQSTTKFKVTGMAKGDKLKSVVSSNKNIVKVSSVKANGTLKLTAGKKTGTAKLTFKLASGLTKTVKVTVQKGNVKTTSIKGVQKTLTVKKGKTARLVPVLSPVTSQDKITYTSSDKKTATVTSKGVVKGKKTGTVKITIKSGSKKITCKVKVVK